MEGARAFFYTGSTFASSYLRINLTLLPLPPALDCARRL